MIKFEISTGIESFIVERVSEKSVIITVIAYNQNSELVEVALNIAVADLLKVLSVL